jgi:hypothetical protein
LPRSAWDCWSPGGIDSVAKFGDSLFLATGWLDDASRPANARLGSHGSKIPSFETTSS